MKRCIYTMILLLLAVFSTAQGYEVEGLIQNLPERTVYLSSFYKSEYKVVDSTKAVNGTFYFHRSDQDPRAMYRIDIERPEKSRKQSNSGFIEFIWGNESFKVYADYKNLANSVFFENSEENSFLAEFTRYETSYESKMSALFPLIDRYPEDDTFFIEAKGHFVKMQEARDKFIRQMTASKPDLFASKIISSYRTPVLQPELRGQDRIAFLQQHFFDLAPVDNPELLYAPVYNKKIIECLKLFGNQNYSFGEQEDAFILAVDFIMANVSGDPELRTFIVEYLLEGFESFGMEEIQTYIVDTYVDETCETDAVDLAVERVLGYRKMAKGAIAKDIFIRSFDNTMVRLSEVNADYTLVIFWATYCEHCAELMPKIQEWYAKEKPDNLEIFSVSIDTVEANKEKFSEEVQFPWINTHEPMGWEGKSAEDYNVYATPTMFLLDRKREILAKPFTFRDLLKEVRKIQ